MRFNYFPAGNVVGRALLALLALILLASPGCAQIAQPSEAATPPAEQPGYASVAAKYFPQPWRTGPHSKISRFPGCGGCMGSKVGAGSLACILSITAICGPMRFSSRTRP